jgi:hypothetical protein
VHLCVDLTPMVAWRGVARLWLWLCLCPLVVAAKDCARIYQQKNGACGAPSVEGASVGRRGKGEGGLPTCVAGRFNSRSPFVLTQVRRLPTDPFLGQQACVRMMMRRRVAVESLGSCALEL